MKMKKLLTVVLSLAVMVAAVAGCTSKPKAATGVPSGSINFYYWDVNQQPGMDAMVQLFEKSNPEVKVVSTIIPWAQYWTKLQTALPSGSGPDVFWMNTNLAQYVDSNLITDLTPLITKDNVDMTKFPDLITKLYTVDGKVYGIPKDFDTVCMFYNKSIFDQMGVAYPKADWTWADFLATAQKLTTKDHFGVAIDPNSTQTGVFPWILENGGNIIPDDQTTVNINDDAQVVALQFVHDLIYKYKVSPTPAQNVEQIPDDQFMTGKAAMEETGSWMVSTYYQALGDKVDVVQMPKGKQSGTQSNGLAFVIAKQSKNPDAAWAFTKFAATKDAQASTAKVVIPAYTGASDAWVALYPSMNLKAFIDSMAFAKAQDHWAKSTTEVNKAYTDGLATISISADTNIKQLLTDTQTKMQGLLK